MRGGRVTMTLAARHCDPTGASSSRRGRVPGASLAHPARFRREYGTSDTVNFAGVTR